jgi:hypothetical protein
MLCIIHPLLCHDLNVLVSDLEGNLPIVDGEVGNGVVRNLIRHIISFILGFIVGHDGKVLLDVVEVDLELLVYLVRINCTLVDLLQEIEFGSRMFEIVFASQYRGNVMNEPLSVDTEEFVAEGIRLKISD